MTGKPSTQNAPTDEQAQIIRSKAPVIVTRALAGTGKTTTLRGFTAARPDQKFLYLVFNKANQNEAKASFPRNTTPMTSHALAFKAIGHQYQRKLGDLKPVFISRYFGVDTRMAAEIGRLIHRFTSSPETTFSDMRLSRADQNIAHYAERLWQAMCDRSNETIKMTHDGYLKLFAIGGADVHDFDSILFDEAQDANPITAMIVARLARRQISAGNGGQLVIVGDDNQSIYGFRGAVNALDQFRGEPFSLTKGFRFGQAVADAANAVLAQTREPLRLQGLGGPSMVHHREIKPKGAYTYLARTNADVLYHALETKDEPLHFVGGIETYRVNRVLDAHALTRGDRSRIEDTEIRQFTSLAELTAYADQAEDPEMQGIVRLVEEYRDALPNMIATLRKRAACPVNEARIMLTTAHRSKGLEWDNVILGEFFDWGKYKDALTKGEGARYREELNLLYVATTRARKNLVSNTALRAAMREEGLLDPELPEGAGSDGA